MPKVDFPHSNGFKGLDSLPQQTEFDSELDSGRSSAKSSDRFVELPNPPTESQEWSSVSQELVDTLPQAWTRGLLYFLILFASIFLPWAAAAKVDETGSARGRIEPQGKSVRLDIPVGGTVTYLGVKEGQKVRAGQPLLKIESDVLRSEMQEAQARLNGLSEQRSRLEGMRNEIEISIQSQRLQSQAQQQAQLARIEQLHQQSAASQNAYDLSQERVKRDRVELKRYQRLASTGAVPQVKVTELQGLMGESRQTLNKAHGELKQAQSGIEEQRNNYDNVKRTGELSVLESEGRIKELEARMSQTQSDIAQARQQIKSFRYRLQQHTLSSPVNGTIFNLSLDHVGTVVQPGQAVASIAPKGAKFIFRANMPSQESGFIRLGQAVKLKFDAYPFQDYGVVPGKLVWISPDSKMVETSAGKLEMFELSVELEQLQQLNNRNRINLNPGQTATAEVVIRQRRVIDFIIDPFKKLQNGGLKL
jgi:hemolysin D